MADPFGWYANRFAAGVVIAAATGFLTTFVLMIVQFSMSDGDHNPFRLIVAALVVAATWGPIGGGVLGGLFAFIALISLLKHMNPWQAFVPLTLGASIGLGIEVFVSAKVFPSGSCCYQPIVDLALFIASPTLGGIAAGVIFRERLQRKRGELEQVAVTPVPPGQLV